MEQRLFNRKQHEGAACMFIWRRHEGGAMGGEMSVHSDATLLDFSFSIANELKTKTQCGTQRQLSGGSSERESKRVGGGLGQRWRGGDPQEAYDADKVHD